MTKYWMVRLGEDIVLCGNYDEAQKYMQMLPGKKADLSIVTVGRFPATDSMYYGVEYNVDTHTIIDIYNVEMDCGEWFDGTCYGCTIAYDVPELKEAMTKAECGNLAKLMDQKFNKWLGVDGHEDLCTV